MKPPIPLARSIFVILSVYGRSVSNGADLSGTITYGGSQTGQVYVLAQQSLPGNQVLNLNYGGPFSMDTVEITGLTNLAGSELTVQGWFRGNTFQSAVRQQSSGWVVFGWNGLHILQNDGGVNGISAGTGITDGNWHHVLFTWKQGVSDGFASYLDGRPVASRASADVPIPNYGSSVWLGSFNGGGEFTYGQLDAIGIWQRFMSPSEVATNWSKALKGTEPGLLAYWDFDDGTFNDKTTNHFDGTASGSAAVVAAGIPGFNGAGNAITNIPGPGAYSITGLPTGPGYAVTAFLDANGNGHLDPGEPSGAYSGNPFSLNGNMAGVDIQLKEPPAITVQPVGTRQAVGGSASFQVAATGTPPLSYQWFNNGVAVTDGGRISGATTTNLQINGLLASDTGAYSCLVTNGQGSVSSSVASLQVVANGLSISGSFIYGGARTGKVYTTVAQLRTNNLVLSLDGTTGYGLTTLTDLSGDELSIEYWFRGSAVTSAVRQQGSDYIVVGWGANYDIISTDGGVAKPINMCNPLSRVVDGNWHHVAMTWKRNTAGGFASYFDGALVQQRDSSDTPIPSIGAQVYFGSFNGTAEFAHGQLDEIAIWSRSLSAGEIASHSVSGLTGKEPNLTGYWNFDDGVGNDLSPGGNNVELHGGSIITNATIPGLGASYFDAFAGIGSFQIQNIPAANGYALSAYLDANGNGVQDPDEPRGTYAGNLFNLTGNLSGVTVPLYDPPAIISSPATVTVRLGDTLQVGVIAAGTSNTYQWQYYSTPLANGGRVSGAQSPTLAIASATLADAGVYAVVISNVVGTLTQNIAVFVQPSSLTNGLVAYYPFDETSGTNAPELTGLSQAGQLYNFPTNNSEWVPGVVSNALVFGGPVSQSYVLAPDYFKPTNTMTVSAWVWATNPPTWASIAKNWGGAAVGQFHFGLDGDSGHLSNYLTDNNGTTVNALESVALPLESWQHVGFVADGARVRLYHNGVEVATSALYSGTLVYPTMTSLAIGVKTDDSGTVPDTSNPGYWNGKIDDLGIWNRALSPEEMSGIYQAGLNGRSLAQAVAVSAVTITISLSGNQVTVSYTTGTLESADTLGGAWTPVPGANPPAFTTSASAGEKFFRVR